MSKKQSQFIPALRYNGLTRLYDPIVRLTTQETAFKRRLVEIAQVRGEHRVLDVGCGTGTLALLIQKTQVGTEVFGVDADLKVLTIASSKASASGSPLLVNAGMVFDLPYPDGCFDRLFSTLMFHHLTSEAKRQTLQEALRVLKPGGQLCVADWGEPANPIMRMLFFLVQLLDGFTTTADNVNGLLPRFMRVQASLKFVNPVTSTLFLAPCACTRQ